MDPLCQVATDFFMDENYDQALLTYDLIVKKASIDKSYDQEALAEVHFKRGLTHHKLNNIELALKDTASCIEILDNCEKNTSAFYAKACFKKGFYQSKQLAYKDALVYLNKAKELGHIDASLDSLIQTASTKVAEADAEAAAQAKALEIQQTIPAKVRHEWYQNETHVYVSVMIKKVSADKVKVDFFPKEFVLNINQPTGSDFQFTIDPLALEINPEESSFTVLNTKIEIRLKKQVVGIKWADLEGKDSSDIMQPMSTAQDTKPIYPSSSRNPKNWDVLSKEAEAVEKELEGEGDLNSVFQKIYKSSDEDTRRAMLKSFTESNGTALSTNWKEVGVKKVETSAPDGMEAREWNKY